MTLVTISRDALPWMEKECAELSLEGLFQVRQIFTSLKYPLTTSTLNLTSHTSHSFIMRILISSSSSVQWRFKMQKVTQDKDRRISLTTIVRSYFSISLLRFKAGLRIIINHTSRRSRVFKNNLMTKIEFALQTLRPSLINSQHKEGGRRRERKRLKRLRRSEESMNWERQSSSINWRSLKQDLSLTKNLSKKNHKNRSLRLRT